MNKGTPRPATPYVVYDPLDTESIIESLTAKLFEQPLLPLPPDPFYGAGVYALYYFGSFEPYAPISGMYQQENHRPIYVGKADPPGGLRGVARSDALSTKLYDRLREHGESISEASNLDVSEFRCRYLVVAPLFIGLAESILIGSHKPAWNGSGFGNHPPGGGRTQQKQSCWDIVHPGRKHGTSAPVDTTRLEKCLKDFTDRIASASAISSLAEDEDAPSYQPPTIEELT